MELDYEQEEAVREKLASVYFCCLTRKRGYNIEMISEKRSQGMIYN